MAIVDRAGGFAAASARIWLIAWIAELSCVSIETVNFVCAIDALPPRLCVALCGNVPGLMRHEKPSPRRDSDGR
jgi:hypothetical protein